MLVVFCVIVFCYVEWTDENIGGILVTKSNLDVFLEIFDTLTPENRDRIVELLEAAAHNQSASSDFDQSAKETD